MSVCNPKHEGLSGRNGENGSGVGNSASGYQSLKAQSLSSDELAQRVSEHVHSALRAVLWRISLAVFEVNHQAVTSNLLDHAALFLRGPNHLAEEQIQRLHHSFLLSRRGREPLGETADAEEHDRHPHPTTLPDSETRFGRHDSASGELGRTGATQEVDNSFDLLAPIGERELVVVHRSESRSRLPAKPKPGAHSQEWPTTEGDGSETRSGP